MAFGRKKRDNEEGEQAEGTVEPTAGARDDPAAAEEPAALAGDDPVTAQEPVSLAGEDPMTAERPTPLAGEASAAPEQPTDLAGRDGPGARAEASPTSAQPQREAPAATGEQHGDGGHDAAPSGVGTGFAAAAGPAGDPAAAGVDAEGSGADVSHETAAPDADAATGAPSAGPATGAAPTGAETLGSAAASPDPATAPAASGAPPPSVEPSREGLRGDDSGAGEKTSAAGGQPQQLIDERPEVLVGGAFVAGVLAARILGAMGGKR